ncbi:antibiotic biosynthesis monooxygenase [Oceaniradius stylonematis]|uniref:Antibiotic biosynthesis monooxygenase n=1 Tax=Oceaniradius stylonematis TaxID=2184161 RepID=A0A3A8AB49_9HYPH|nr:antibiotic biosynthesis monooxygenase [Oceaniradius stylonematis]RKF06229.1 antibiotic biosynthesis monooxygenase [Oceaniradius stylonematis]
MSEPVTVIARRRVRPGSEQAYEDWLERLTTEAKDLPGYVGAEFHRPEAGEREYRSVFRFDSLENLEAFERSDLRARYLEEIAPHVDGDAAWDRMTGLEVWFDPPPGTVVPQPSPHRMAALLIAVVFVLVLALNLVLDPLIGGWPLALRLLLTVTLQVLAMTYLIMPRLTRALARWIYPSTQTVS